MTRSKRAVAAVVVLLIGAVQCSDQGPDVSPASITIGSPSSSSLASGARVQLLATVSNSHGGALAATPVQWSSSDPNIIVVSPTGSIVAAHVGSATVMASAGSIHSAAVSFTVTPGAAATLFIRTQPNGAASGARLTTQPVLEIRDSVGNPVPTASNTITATLATGGGSLRGSTATGVNGVATFTDLTVSGLIGDRTITFSADGVAPVTSGGFALVPGAPSTMIVRTDPAGAAVGAPLATQPVLEIRDDAGNLATNATTSVTASLSGGVGTIGGNTASAVGGVVAFSSLSVSGTPGKRSITFTAAGLPSVTSGSFTIAAGPPVRLNIRSQPDTAISGRSLAKQPVIEVLDAAGNLSSAAVTVTADISGSGVASFNSVTAVNGVATFSSLSIYGSVGSYTLTFRADGLQSVTSAPFFLTSRAASQLALQVLPGGLVSGAKLTQQPVVLALDETGQIDPTYNAPVTASIASGFGTLSGAVVSTSNGIARFSSLAITATGTVTLLFKSGALAATLSGPITSSTTPTGTLVVSQGPSLSAPSGGPLPVQPIVLVTDGAGHTLDVSIPVSITTDAISGTITNGTVTTVHGVAAFSAITLAGPLGARNYWFTAPGFPITGLYRITIY